MTYASSQSLDGMRRGVDRFATDHRAQHLGLQYLSGWDLGDVAVKNNEISGHARSQCALPLLSEFSVCGTRGVCGNRLVDSQWLAHISFVAGLILACDSGIDTTEGRDGFDRIIRA